MNWVKGFQLFYHKTNDKSLREKIAIIGLGVQKYYSKCSMAKGP